MWYQTIQKLMKKAKVFVDMTWGPDGVLNWSWQQKGNKQFSQKTLFFFGGGGEGGLVLFETL